ncbi:iron-containing alcohol dehydrogenase [Ectobacillus ponti]|uniref:Iron-containing alcohol dehydrogenase n=1 Tax=Ectobacillus ponti TaxID=2961894 RepID=A0AA41XCS5_9BACI|nr:iron-containing alcohol dehydrogenase [Ectobacillus ponti]MCP8971298.1 iron-containing alcohol dehydrogenase [Ectobacillus ponti]
MYKLYCRTHQAIFRGVSRFMPWRRPELLEGEGSLSLLPKLVEDTGITSVLLVTDKGISRLGLLDGLLADLTERGISFTVYDGTHPNPTIQNIEEALQLYQDKQCSGIIAFGGGSPMDCAKGVGARVARPDKSIPDLRGEFKIRRKIPPLFAVPTTAGTGSEATVAAVISNSDTHEKYAINDFVLIPPYAVLDPLLTVKLPPHITAATGMDALTHAVEAYIGRSNTEETRQCCREAVQLIFENLHHAYENGENLTARANMQRASYLAGVAFTRAFVGYVHAIAHTLGGFYGMPHGLANAMILPYVLDYYGESAHQSLAELADLVHITSPADTTAQKAEKFIAAIRKFNRDLDIPEKASCIQDPDIPLMAKRALKEANPLYPVPEIMNKRDMMDMYSKIKQ